MAEARKRASAARGTLVRFGKRSADDYNANSGRDRMIRLGRAPRPRFNIADELSMFDKTEKIMKPRFG